jgi:hypothetical protein
MKIDIHNLKAIVSATESAYYLLNNVIEDEKNLNIMVKFAPDFKCLQIIFDYIIGFKEQDEPNLPEEVRETNRISIVEDSPVHKIVKDVIDMLEIIYNMELRTFYDVSYNEKYSLRKEDI